MQEWTLPNGEIVTLFRREGPGFPDADSERATAALHLAQQMFTYNLAETPIVYGSPELGVWVGRADPPGAPRVMPAEWARAPAG